jgi:hypothetical protein
MVALGLDVDVVVDAVVHRWQHNERGLQHGLNEPWFFRSSLTHADQIAEILWTVAKNPSEDIESRSNAVASLWWLSPTPDEDALAAADFGNQYLNRYMNGLLQDGSARHCKDLYYRSAPRRQ